MLMEVSKPRMDQVAKANERSNQRILRLCPGALPSIFHQGPKSPIPQEGRAKSSDVLWIRVSVL